MTLSRFYSDPVLSEQEGDELSSPGRSQNSVSAAEHQAVLRRLRELEAQVSQTSQRSYSARDDATLIGRGRSVLTPHTSRSMTHTATTATANASKIKGNPPPLFDPAKIVDVRLWILKMDDYFSMQHIADLAAQATCALSYFNDAVKRRTQRLRLTGDIEPFTSWPRLQTWLKENYGPPDTRLEANLAMDRCQMKSREPIQEFINRFETIIADLDWNEPAVCASFRKKLSRDIVDTVHMLHPGGWPETFATFKRYAQEADNHLRIGKRAQEEHSSPPRAERIRFDQRDQRDRKPFSDRQNNAITPEEQARRKERRRRRENNLCLDCGQAGHWTNDPKCNSPANLSKNKPGSQ